MRYTSCFSAQDTPSFLQVLEDEETKTKLIVKPLSEAMLTLSPQFHYCFGDYSEINVIGGVHNNFIVKMITPSTSILITNQLQYSQFRLLGRSRPK